MNTTESSSLLPLQSPSSSSSILSDKVQRALQVRVDTPAMKAALEALGQLVVQAEESSFHHLDARSVRHAIEYDALQQALLLKNELISLRDQTRQVRQGIARTTEIANRIQEAIHTDVMRPRNNDSTTLAMSLLPSASGGANMDNPQQAVADTSTSLKAEEELAASLAEAFSRREVAQQRLEAVQQFLDTFDLSAEDSKLLDQYNFEDMTGSSTSINLKSAILMSKSSTATGMAFLQALERVREIRMALTQSLGEGSSSRQSEVSNQSPAGGLGASSALRMMEGLAQKQERAYERLYHWLQVHLQLFGKGRTHEDSLNMDHDEDDELMDQALQQPFVQRSLYALRHVPAFYRHTLELIASRRRQEETRKFLLALTVGYGGALPMERLAHDSVAYTGDMLAFCFRTFSAEADVAQTLIHYKPEEEETGSKTTEGEKGRTDVVMSSTINQEETDYSDDQPMSASAFLSSNMSGMARPLKSRILQVIATLARRPDEADVESDDGMIDDFDEEGAVVRQKITQIYEICGLILFYISAMEKTVAKLKVLDTDAGLSTGENDALIEQLVGCLGEAARAFEATVRVYCAMLTQVSSQTGESESSLGLALVVLIAEVRLTSPGFAQDVACPAECEKQLSIEWVTETVMEACMSSCQVLDDTVALKQTIAAAKKAGFSVIASEKLEDEIEQTEDRLIDALIEEETAKVLDLCGLGPIASSWRLWKDTSDEGEMVTFPGLSPENMEASMKHFYSSLFSPPLPSLDSTIRDPIARRTARSRIASNICEIYQCIYDDLQTSGGYEDLSFLGHTPEQVRTLFSA